MTVIAAGRLRLESLKESDATDRYAAWLNDPEVNRFLESRFSVQSVESCRNYISNMRADPLSHLFGMFDLESGMHIGNIKIFVARPVHRTGEIGLLIGEKPFWGKGLAADAIRAVTRWAFEFLELEKLEANCYDENIASLRAFLKSGYSVEGYRRKSYLSGERRIGAFTLGILRGESGAG